MLRFMIKLPFRIIAAPVWLGTCSGEYCAGVPGWIICRILLSDSRNLCCDRSFEYWVWNQYGLDNEISDYYDSSVCSTPTYRYGDSCSN